jgi:4,5-DOPA dioxygenase extradiol
MAAISDNYPAVFIGHGSPMNIVTDNQYTRDLKKLRNQLKDPTAILVISAHWLTRGTRITSGASPKQIYDFYGFPQELYEVKYESPGSPEIAETIIRIAGNKIITADNERGIDHAAWSVLKHLYPEQQIPVLELSLDMEKEPGFHFELGQKLAELRKMDILVIGSGNIIHNLREVDFDDNAAPFPWALEFDSIVKNHLEAKEYKSLINFPNLGKNSMRAIPTSEHYLPMLFTLGMFRSDESVSSIHDSIQNGSVSMRSFITTQGFQN